MDVDSLNGSLAQRRGRRENRQLPKRYRDMLPDLPAALPPPLQSTPIPPGPEPATPPSSPSSPVRKFLTSTRNLFGLFRQYRAICFPEHDPDNLTSNDLIDPTPSSLSAYHPYPTQSSFLLGEWYWNDGTKKSQSSFDNLLKIVGHPDFRPEDVARTNWRHTNVQLGRSSLGEDDWEDEQVDRGWIETPIKIKVPFHKRTLHPGQEEFEVGKLYHRKLVSVIQEKISRASSHPHFHLEPYTLYWQPNDIAERVRVHGELYSSEAFIDVHRDLQDSPGEPGCRLPRVVVGLMFASDGTQLTAFSNAKLWPLYLAFGNESKYRRSKPSCQAFEHVAYFETVSTPPFRANGKLKQFNLVASRLLQGLCGRAHWQERAEQRVHGALSPRTISRSVGSHS